MFTTEVALGMPLAKASFDLRKRQWRRTLAGLACIGALLGILVIEGLRRHQPDALAMVAFGLVTVATVVVVRRMPEASP